MLFNNKTIAIQLDNIFLIIENLLFAFYNFIRLIILNKPSFYIIY